VTATKTIKTLTCHEKTPFDSSLRSHLKSNTLPQSAFNAESIDVWYGQNKWWEDIEKRKRDGDRTLTYHEKPPYDSSLRRLLNPNTLPQSASNAESIDVWYGQNKWWEDIEKRKRDDDRTIKKTYPPWKNALRLESSPPCNSKHTAANLVECLIDWCMIEEKQMVRRHRKAKTWRRQNTCLSWKNALRIESSPPFKSRHTAAIGILCGIDWCMIRSKQTVRRHRKSRKQRRQNK